MLKKTILYSLLFLLTFSLNSCRKPEDANTESPDDIIINILAEVNLEPEVRYHLVVENSESPSAYFQITNYFGFVLLRRDDFKGSKINLHFILVDKLGEHAVSIKSFFDVPIGIEIRITDENLMATKAINSSVNLSFTNIPDFDIISRTAKYPEQGFTLESFETPATTPELGGETYESGKLFYSCFQTGASAAYKLERVPNNGYHTIDFSNLNSNVLKHTFPKNIDGASITHADVNAYNNPFFLFSHVEIFNLDYFNIFPSSTFDIFIPKSEIELVFYTQDFIYETSDHIFNYWSYSRLINSNINLLNAGLKTVSRVGQLPIIESVKETYDEAVIVFEDENFQWTMHSPNTSGFYIPVIPIKISNNFPEANTLQQMFLNQEGGKVKLINYEPLEGYEEALDLHLGETNLMLESNYHTQEQLFSIK